VGRLERVEEFGLKCNPNSGATGFAVFHDLIRDRAGNVYRDGKSHARSGIARSEEGRIDANELTAEIDQSSLGISRIDSGIGLNEIFVLPKSQRPPEGQPRRRGSNRAIVPAPQR
jgi:hypothetical protein